VLKKKSIIRSIYNHLIEYPTPCDLNYAWSFGSLLGLILVMQIFTGIVLAMYYTPNSDLAFNSIERIMRDINNGWLFRYMHSNGASFFFLFTYCHIAKNFYYKVYQNSEVKYAVWLSGCVIFIVMMATAFMGYVLPWAQMSFLAATVITNLFTALPIIGEDFSMWLWGGFSVNNNTLNKFYALHFLLPFVLVGLVILHITLLHIEGSNTPYGKPLEFLPFFPYFFFKDLVAFLTFLFVFMIVVCFYPNVLGDPDNYIKANPVITPPHIVPEWYFLFFYAILRTIPDKLLGVLYLAISLGILFITPILDISDCQFTEARPMFDPWFWYFVTNLVVLSWLGAQELSTVYLLFSKFSIFFFFADMFFVLPGMGWLENDRYSKRYSI